MGKIRGFIYQLSYTVLANVVKIISTSVLTLLIPRLMNLSDYGYWQLYIFYSGYIGFFHLGWCDGIYLKEGGKKYDDLSKSSYKTQFFSLFILQIIFSLIIMLFTYIYIDDINKTQIMFFVCLNALTCIPSTLLSYILQCTGRIKEYAISNILGRSSYFILTILFLVAKLTDFRIILIADILGWVVQLVYSLYMCRDIFISKFENFYITIREIYMNISIGSKLLIANLASSFIVGVIRLMMERHWDIVEFGKVSLALNFCNILLVFINAISIVIYPILKNVTSDNLKKYYGEIDGYLLMMLITSLIVFFPLSLLILNFLPQFTNSIVYMAILFPICLYESKAALLVNTYLKVLREERMLMLLNVITLGISFMISYVSVFVLDNIVLSVYSILIILSLRCILCELYLSYKLGVNSFRNIFVEIIFTIIFIICSWLAGGILGFIMYFSCILVYFFLNKEKKFALINRFRNLRNSNGKEMM